MTCRDRRKPAAHWKKVLASQKLWVRDAEKGCATARSSSGRESACRWVWWKRLEHLIASYSAGCSVEEMREQYAALVPAFVHHATSKEYVGSSLKLMDYYVRLLWLVSLGYLLGDRAGVAAIARHAKHDGKDEVLDRLIALSIPRHRISKGLVHRKLTTSLLAALRAKSAAASTAALRAHLDSRLAALRPAWFWNGHKSEDILYFGYWSFESAAVAKARKLDIAALAGNGDFPVLA